MDDDREERIAAIERYLRGDEREIPGTPVSSPSSVNVLPAIIVKFGTGFSVQIPVVNIQFVKFRTESLIPYFKYVYKLFMPFLYPEEGSNQAESITEAEFCGICRLFVKAKIDLVFKPYSSSEVTNIVREISVLPKELEVPKCIADLINGIGKVLVFKGAFTVVPEPDDMPTEGEDKWWNLINEDSIKKFTVLVQAIKNRGFIQTGFMTDDCKGTAWWMMSARNTRNLTHVANFDDDTVTVCAAFKDYTTADEFMCAVTKRGNYGLIHEYNIIKRTMRRFHGVIGLTKNFILDAQL